MPWSSRFVSRSAVIKIRAVLVAGLALAGFVAAGPASAEVSVPAVIASHMVLQRGVPVPIWGWAAVGEEVTVTLDARTEKTQAVADGGWRVTFPAVAVGGDPHTLTVAATNTLRFDDILVGDVWVGSGQSNMEWSLAASGNAKEAIAAAEHPQVRLFHVPKVQAKTPEHRITSATWKPYTPDSAKGFSAVLYHFGIALQSELKIPIGLINASRDGQPLTEFEVAGADEKFLPATATIDGETILVTAASVSEPKFARFGWRSVARPNLVNSAGLPASPFQTKDWRGGTSE